AFDIRVVPFGTTLTVYGSNIANSFAVGEPTLDNIHGNLSLHGGAGSDTLALIDGASTGRTTWRIGDTGLQRITWGALAVPFFGQIIKLAYVDVLAFDLTDIEFVNIEGGGVVDSFFGPPTATTGQRYEILPNAAENVRITGGTADDTYVFGSDGNG